ncbi:hypothetical protein [Corynebacterium hadale]|uniref:hypothetical protein n=1 Tax=Corynebacterium hadale TaxID=2026255 RepID=UPI0010561905|nr:hypothetical protein [Corynebacterium hadale]
MLITLGYPADALDLTALARKRFAAATFCFGVKRLLSQAQLKREQLLQEAQEMRDQADAETQQIRAEARRARDAALKKGWQQGFDQASQAVDEIVDEFRNDLVSDRLRERYQSVSMKIRKRQQSSPHQQVRPSFQPDL